MDNGRALRIFIAPDGDAAAHPSTLSPLVAYERSAASAGAPPFAVVHQLSDSDVCVLPRRWNYYIARKRQDEAVAVADEARRFGKRTLVWFTGDLPPIIPIPDAVVLKCSMYRSRWKPGEFAAPAFIDDPAPALPDGVASVRPKRDRPLVGFCGYAGVRLLKMAYGAVSSIASNVDSLRGCSPYEQVPVLPATLLRARALKLLSHHRSVDTRFVIRDRYKAGHRTPSPESAVTVREFFSNIVDTDYTVCIRGYGNFSIRFYETLACGRIPVFVDTDCVLPFQDRIDWRKYCVWVDRHELRAIGDKVAAFHAALSARDFIELQHACRRLWEDCLSLGGFMTHLHTYVDGTLA